jgi:hypothetical protein
MGLTGAAMFGLFGWNCGYWPNARFGVKPYAKLSLFIGKGANLG